MTNIYGVDATAQAWQPDNNRPSTKDFARELAKHDEQAKTNLQNDAKTNQDAEFENPSLTEAGKVELPSLPGESTLVVSAQETRIIELSEAQQLAGTTVTPTGVTEALLGARVFGWHAMAQAYLSELTAADSGEKPRAASEEQELSSANTLDESVEVSAASEPVAMAVTEATIVAPQLQEAGQVQARFAPDDAASPNMAELALADTSATSYWSERSIRFTRQRDGASVAWLRDFRISDTEASHLIQLVLNDAKAKGVALSKIMLNGREAWTSPNSH